MHCGHLSGRAGPMKYIQPSNFLCLLCFEWERTAQTETNVTVHHGDPGHCHSALGRIVSHLIKDDHILFLYVLKTLHKLLNLFISSFGLTQEHFRHSEHVEILTNGSH